MGKQGSRQKGSGIGLSLVRSILQLHHVEWKVESVEGRGTRFFLSFPKSGIRDTPGKGPEPRKATDPPADGHERKKSSVVKLFLLVFTVFSCSGCYEKKAGPVGEDYLGLKVVQEWNGLLLEMVRHAGGYKAPVSARMFAYTGLAAWESGKPAFSNSLSASGLGVGPDLPDWEGEEAFCAAASLNGAYNVLAQEFFPYLPPQLQKKRAMLAGKWEALLTGRKMENSAIAASTAFGQSVATAIFRWSAGDTIGHEAFLSNYRAIGEGEKGPGQWQPGSGKSFGLLPDWGNARTFVVSPEEVEIRAPLQFSENPQTSFFREAMEIYTVSRPISTERRNIAYYWSNDYPGLSVCPASRWVAIAHQVVETEQPGLASVLEIYMKLGFALNDAAVKVWKEKYTFNLERPDTYISRNIDPTWHPLETPPAFPSYPSGHSTLGSAAAAILEAAFGRLYTLTDFSIESIGSHLMEPRIFTSFDAMARENALSRVYMGVHYRMDCEEGLRLGRAIGKRIAAMEMTLNNKLAVSRYSQN